MSPPSLRPDRGARIAVRRLQGAVRLARAAAHVLRGVAIARRFDGLPAHHRAAHVQQWAQRMLAILGVAVQAHGRAVPGPCLLVANHVSWLDILAIHAVCPQARFVAKAQVRHWPVLGWLVHAAGTLFIERERTRDAMRVVHHVAEALRAGDTVAVFPEGTTSEGHGVLPFHANLLQSAIAVQVPVQPVVLRFADARHAISPAAPFVGETTLWASLWAVLGAEGLAARVQLLEPLPAPHPERRALARVLRERVVAALETSPGVGT